MGAFLVGVSRSSFQLEISNEWKFIKFLFLSSLQEGRGEMR
jgi:hypothetical protein